MRKLRIEELNRVDLAEYEQPKMPVVLLCDNIRSMYNVGSVFRTADAFKIEKIDLCGITAQPPHKKIRKTALSAESVDWSYEKESKPVLKLLINDAYIPIVVEQVEGS